MTEHAFDDSRVPIDALRTRAFNMRWAEQAPDVIPLTAADPDFTIAPAIRDALIAEVSTGVLSYGPAGGLPRFRSSVARYLNSRKSASVEAGQVIAVNSAAAGLAMVARQRLQPGDEAIVMDPVDFLFAHTVKSAGGVPVRWSVTRRGELDLDRLRALITPRTKLISICNPHNPLGRCFTREELTAIGRIAVEHDLHVLSDEIWSEVVYSPTTFTSALSLDAEIRARTTMVHGFSKSFGLAGLRIGYVTCASVNEAKLMLERSEHPSTVDGAVTLSQIAAAAAYDHALDWLDAFLEHLKARRDQTVEALRTIDGIEVDPPDATYVVFPKVSHPALKAGESVEDAVARLRDFERVAVVPGSPRWFGEGAKGHLRICFATSKGILAEGLRRVRQGLARP
ncbi:MAG: pyridoxal phosphate-dependent aminotransferase [Phycisphaerales bacterium]